MAPSTSPALPPPEATAAARFGLNDLDRFYRFHARIYDWTRPCLLFGRSEAALALGAGPGDLVLDVGCGTGVNLPRLVEAGATVVGVEPSGPMRVRAEARLAALRSREKERLRLDPRPYGTHDDYAGEVAGILFSYSLSMVPPFAEVLARARADLRPGGRLSVVDFLDASLPLAQALAASHVHLGPARLREIQRLFPRHRLSVRRALGWRYYGVLAEA
jgi:S-adenosylmethionine-diacylgycerolhomoserine-N-methlytransferase